MKTFFAHLYVFILSLFSCLSLQRSSSSESLSEKGPSELKSFDAVVFDVLKVTPEEYAVSRTDLWGFMCLFVYSSRFYSPRLHLVLNRDLIFFFFVPHLYRYFHIFRPEVWPMWTRKSEVKKKKEKSVLEPSCQQMLSTFSREALRFPCSFLPKAL